MKTDQDRLQAVRDLLVEMDRNPPVDLGSKLYHKHLKSEMDFHDQPLRTLQSKNAGETVTTTHPADYECIPKEKEKPKSKDTPGFTAMSRLNAEDNDLIDLLTLLKPAALKTFKEIKDNFNYRNNLSHCSSGITHSEKVIHSRALKELKGHNIIKTAKMDENNNKVPTGTLMINPYLIIPLQNYGVIQYMWNTLK